MAKMKRAKAPKSAAPIIVMMSSGAKRAGAAVKRTAGKAKMRVGKAYNRVKSGVQTRNARFNGKTFARRTLFAVAGGVASSVGSAVAGATANKYDDSILVQGGVKLGASALLNWLIPGENTEHFTSGWTGDSAGRGFDAAVKSLLKG